MSQKLNTPRLPPRRHFTYYQGSREIIPFYPIIDLKNRPREPYRPGILERSSLSQHMGQRKLLISEVQLLNTYYREQWQLTGKDTKYTTDTTKTSIAPVHPVVVYIGSAPGSHLLFIKDLFPHLTFILYDGARFDPELAKYPETFILRNQYFTTDTCKQLLQDPTLTGHEFILVSDIRLGANDKDQFEQQVMRDMDLQAEWVRALRPLYSLLKFRLPYNLQHGAKVPYFMGDLYYGIWAKIASGETRLLVRHGDIDSVPYEYDFTTYEEVMFFHNHYVRACCFPREIRPEYEEYIYSENNCYCTCFDCMTELATYTEYITSAMPHQGREFTLAGIIKMYADYFTRGELRFPISYDRGHRILKDFQNPPLRDLGRELAASHGR